jgi:hypothetical protein
VDDVVDLIFSQCEDLGEPAADFVEENHCADGLPAVAAGELCGGDGDQVKVVVPKLAGDVAGRGVETSWCRSSPLADGGSWRRRLWHARASSSRSTLRAMRAFAVAGSVAECLATQHRRSVSASGDGRYTASNGVGMEQLGTAKHRLARLAQATGEKVDGAPAEAEGLVFRTGERYEAIGHGDATCKSERPRAAFSRD